MLMRSTDKPFASIADIAACRTMLRGGSRSFFAASLVLPKSIRESATGLYAFCRMADDAIDHGSDRPRALGELRERLARIYAGDPLDIAADRAFADSVSRHGIPKSFPDALLEGFEWDSGMRRYSDISELKAYGVRVAGSVGAMMAMVMGRGGCTCRSIGCVKPRLIPRLGLRGPCLISGWRVWCNDYWRPRKSSIRGRMLGSRICPRPAGRGCMRLACCMPKSAMNCSAEASIPSIIARSFPGNARLAFSRMLCWLPRVGRRP
jgi:hypothetical protein